MEKIVIKDEFIKLGQLLKLSNMVENGAMAKEVIEEGLVKYNGEVETRRGKKVYSGDVVEFNGESVKVESEN
ncbi:MAG: RNA-binding S4 domain-containing protein [Lachnospiraceae bacterium]|nr:RNA-binding S4 domain-containing protein [Lachnospiraceae bacterium]